VDGTAEEDLIRCFLLMFGSLLQPGPAGHRAKFLPRVPEPHPITKLGCFLLFFVFRFTFATRACWAPNETSVERTANTRITKLEYFLVFVSCRFTFATQACWSLYSEPSYH